MAPPPKKSHGASAATATSSAAHASVVFNLVFPYIKDPRVLAICCLVCSEWDDIVSRSASLWKPFTEKTEMVGAIADTASNSGSEHPSSSRDPKVVSSSDSSGKNRSASHENEADLVWDLKRLASDAEQKNRFWLGPTSVRSLCGHSDSVTTCKVRNGYILSGSADETVRLWNLAGGTCKMVLSSPSKTPIFDVDFDDTKILASCDTEVCIWRRNDGKLLRKIGGHHQRITSITCDDADLFIGCADGSVRSFDVYSSKCTQILRPHSKFVSCLFFSPEKKLIMSGSKDGSVKMHDVPSSDLIYSVSSPHSVQCAQVNGLNNKLYIGYANGELMCYDTRWNGDPLAMATLSPFPLTSLHFQTYGPSTLLASDKSGHLFVVESTSLNCVRTYLLPKSPAPKRTSVSPLASEAVAGSGFTGPTVDTQLAWINCVQMGLSRAVTAGSDHVITLWNFGFPGTR